ncbi:MAG: hypothetical protein R3Y57_01820 [Erysipelotrichaceae bacterium]
MKKLILSFLSVTTIFSACLFVYEVTQRQEAASMSVGTDVLSGDDSVADISAEVSPTTTTKPETLVNEQISNVSEIGTNVYFFYEANSNDSVFLQNNLLKSLFAEIETNQTTLNSIDISVLDDTILPIDMKNNWGFENYPSFVQANYNEDGSFEVLSVLEWNSEKPFNEYMLRQWFISVGLIAPTVEDEGEPIAKEIE